MFGSPTGRTTVGLAIFLALVLGLGWVEFKHRIAGEQAIDVIVVPGAPGATGSKTAAATEETSSPSPAPAEPAPQQQTAAAPAPSTPALVSPASPPSATPEPAAPAQAADNAPTAASPSTTPPAEPASPRFDVVRVEGDGSVVAAGRAPAGAKIALMAGDKTLDNTVADAAGQWVMVPGSTLPPGQHELSLKSQTSSAPAAAASDQTVSVVVPPTPGEQSQVVLHEPGKPPAGAGTEIASAPSPSGDALELHPATGTTPGTATVPPAAQATTPSETQTAAVPATPPTAPAEPAEPVTKLAGGIVIDDVQAVGNSFSMHGHGPAGAPLRIYFNDTIVAEPTVAPDGTWSLTIKQGFVSGEYRIRIDQVERNGHVIASTNRILEHNPPPTAVAQAAPSAPAAATTPSARPNPPAEVTSAETTPTEPVAPPSSAHEAAPQPVAPQSRAAAPTAETPAPDVPAPSEAPVPAPQVQTAQPAVPPEAPATPAAPEVQTASPAAPAAPEQKTAEQPSESAPPPPAQTAAQEPADGSHVVIPELSTVQVQRGDSLWVLSRRQYGRGVLYGIIYKANRDQIRIPRLIYPGQVLVMPAREPS